MALGGGKWFAENKKLPGSYINFEQSAEDAAAANLPSNGGADPDNPYALLTYDLGGDSVIYHSSYVSSALVLILTNDLFIDLALLSEFGAGLVMGATEVISNYC